MAASAMRVNLPNSLFIIIITISFNLVSMSDGQATRAESNSVVFPNKISFEVLDALPWSSRCYLLKNIDLRDYRDSRPIPHVVKLVKREGDTPDEEPPEPRDASEGKTNDANTEGDPPDEESPEPRDATAEQKTNEKGEGTLPGEKPPDPRDVVEQQRAQLRKLFQVMYDSVRDSDIKLKRAEMVRRHYVSSETWEIGFLVGEIETKLEVMTVIGEELIKFQEMWKLIVQVDAFEEVFRRALEIDRIISLVEDVRTRM